MRTHSLSTWKTLRNTSLEPRWSLLVWRNLMSAPTSSHTSRKLQSKSKVKRKIHNVKHIPFIFWNLLLITSPISIINNLLKNECCTLPTYNIDVTSFFFDLWEWEKSSVAVLITIAVNGLFLVNYCT